MDNSVEEMNQLVDEMNKRFIHRGDAFAVQWYDEAKGVGYRKETRGVCTEGCSKKECTHVTNLPITNAVIEAHLTGAWTVGIYQLTEDNTVKWACIDVDIAKRSEGDDLQARVQEQTLLVARTLKKLIGSRFLVENSGGRGYHVWIFFDEPVQARYALAMLNYVEQHTKKIEGITLELFPKRTALRGYGNMVKLPLGVHRKTLNVCLFVDSSWKPHANQYEVLKNLAYVTDKELRTLIKTYNMEVDPSIRIEPTGVGNKLGKTSLPCQTRIMSEGLSEGCRDDGMFAVSCFMRDRGLPLDMARVSMLQLNTRNRPPLHEDIIEQKLVSAYEGDHSPTPCFKNSLDQFCSSSCRFWDGKVRERWTRYGRKDSAVGIISRD